MDNKYSDMRDLLIISCAFLISICAFCQEDEPTDSEKRIEKFSVAKRNEVSIDVISGIAIPALSPRYEYILGRYSGIGADLFVSLDGDGYTDYEKYSLTPYYRQYFFSKQDYGARGFYAEGFLKLFIFREWFSAIINDFSSTGESYYFDTSIGAGIGWKWISKSGFLVDQWDIRNSIIKDCGGQSTFHAHRHGLCPIPSINPLPTGTNYAVAIDQTQKPKIYPIKPIDNLAPR